jgi:hypothetical protein
MKKQTKDIRTILDDFENLLKFKPSINQMYEEIQMMKFKVRPLSGDVLSLNLKNDQFVSTLWSLGKLDEFYQKKISGLNYKDREIFNKIFEEVYQRFQADLNKINIRPFKVVKYKTPLEVEIFRERKLKKTN